MLATRRCALKHIAKRFQPPVHASHKSCIIPLSGCQFGISQSAKWRAKLLGERSATTDANQKGSKPLQQRFSCVEDAKVTVDDRSKLLSLTSVANAPEGGNTVKFPIAYLRDLCNCKSCVSESSGQKTYATAIIPRNLRVRTANVVATDLHGAALALEWENDVPSFPSEHQTLLPLSDLVRDEAPYSHAFPELHPRTTWAKDEMMRHTQEKHNVMTFDELVNGADDGGISKAMHQLTDVGLLFIQQVPENETSVEKLANAFGPLMSSIYGLTWDVRDKPNAENVAYTAGFLQLHQDLLYMKQPPRIQLLHCLRSTAKGGESVFTDGLRAAEDLWLQARQDVFKALMEYPVNYHYRRSDFELWDAKTTIELPSKSTWLNYAQENPPAVRFINWSPPFQGQFYVDGSDAHARSRFDRYMRAAQIFHKVLNAEERLFRYRLDPGECVIFDNRRILHGREAFDIASGERWLKGAYVANDDFEAKVRIVLGSPSADSAAARE